MWRGVYYNCHSTNYAISSLKMNRIIVFIYKAQVPFQFAMSIGIFETLEGEKFCSACDIIQEISLFSNNISRTFISANNKIPIKEPKWNGETNFMSS